jgi:hypothetical protein
MTTTGTMTMNQLRLGLETCSSLLPHHPLLPSSAHHSYCMCSNQPGEASSSRKLVQGKVPIVQCLPRPCAPPQLQVGAARHCLYSWFLRNASSSGIAMFTCVPCAMCVCSTTRPTPWCCCSAPQQAGPRPLSLQCPSLQRAVLLPLTSAPPRQTSWHAQLE